MHKFYITHSSVITPLGPNTITTYAAVKAGVSAYETSCYFSRNRQALVTTNVPDGAAPPLVDNLRNSAKISTRQKRMIQLASVSLTELAKSFSVSDNTPIFIAGPEQLPHTPTPINNLFIDALALQSEINFDRKSSRIFSTGRAAGFHAIDYAFKFLTATNTPSVIVGGVDSYKDPALLAKLDRDSRLLCQGNSDGYAPGEAAGFIVLSKQPADKIVRIFAPGLGMEKGHIYSQEIYRGDGLTQAFQSALRCEANHNIKAVYSSMNGEHFFAKEYGVAMTRNNQAFAKNCKIEHPADCLGDIGAAYASVIISLLTNLSNGNYMTYGSSDGPYRAAMCLQISNQTTE